MKLVREDLDELKWERGDPYSTLGIGRKVQIEEWFRKWAPDAEYTIDKDFNIRVEGFLYLRGTQITELPDNLIVDGYLDLYGTQVTELPEGLSVGRFLDLRGTEIRELPEGLSVGGSLWLEGTPIRELPKDLKVGRKIYKDF